MEFTLAKEYDREKMWFRYKDPRPMEQRNPSMTIQDLWVYAPDERLEIQFVGTEPRGWSVVFSRKVIGFSPEIPYPEPVRGDSIRAAKRLAIELLAAQA